MSAGVARPSRDGGIRAIAAGKTPLRRQVGTVPTLPHSHRAPVFAGLPGRPAEPRLPSWRASLPAWLFGLLLLGSVVAAIVHLGELQEFTRIARQFEPVWLLAALVLQSLTYLCAAAVWQVALTREGRPCSLPALVPMTLAMLFANQAFPSAGLAGSFIVVRALRRRRVPANLVMGALIVGLVTTYGAYLIAVLASLVLLRLYRAVSLPLLLVTGAFSLAAVGLPAALVWYRESLAPRLPAAIARLPAVGLLLNALGSTPESLMRDRAMLTRAIGLQLAEIVLDASTLFVVLIGIGVVRAPSAVFGAFVIASAVSRVIPVPLGLGTFEGSLVAMLHVVGVPLEAALTATLLLRGFTLWLPMLPGLWCARAELRAA